MTAELKERQGPLGGAVSVRRGLYGHGYRSATVVRQAYRITTHDSDEIVLVRSGRAHWVAARMGEKLTLWACHDEFSAEDKFEELVGHDSGWTLPSADLLT